MVTIAEFSIPTSSFALSESLSAFPEVAVEVDRIAAHTPGTTMPCLWVTDGTAPGFETALTEDPTVAAVHAKAEFDGETLYHVEWATEIDDRVRELVDHQGVVLEASARDDRWRVRLRFMTREQFTDFKTYFDDNDARFHLEQVFPSKHPRHTRGDVTPEQYEALTAAVRAGYFRVPRDASIREVAADLGVSHQSVSERLRRGTENLVHDMLFIEPIQDRT